MVFFISCSSLEANEQGEFDIELDGIRINYSIRGKGPIMIVGHLNSGKIGYEMTLKPMENYFTMVYYSPRGTGKSGIPASLEEYGYDSIIYEVELLRKHLKAKSIWMFGHSDQSEIALQYALKYPEKIRGLILSGAHFISSLEEDQKAKKEFENQRKSQAWFAQVLKDLNYRIQFNSNMDSTGRDLSAAPLKWWCYDSASAEKVIPISREISKVGRRKAINGKFPFSREEEFQKLVQRSISYQKKYSQIEVPVLILQGAYDTNNPPVLVKKLANEIPTSTLVFVDKAGHFPWVEQPEQSFDELTQWLKVNGVRAE